ncbi:MAG TPA: MarR family transcriptional regulator [Gammaproteobacteria bacterium]|nr:MarR family transcriptional regulator [Gammaproteobacteria bacterium]
MEDRIDRARAQWREVRPELDTSASEVTLRILLIGKYIEQRAGAGIADIGVLPWELDVLSALRRQGPPYRLSAGALARNVMLTCSGMTHRITRLEEKGYVERVPSPNDRRSILVRLTERGQRVVDEAVDRRAADSSHLLDQFSPEERKEFASYLRRLLGHFERGEES